MQILKDKILVLDGAMGTEIQQFNLTEAQFRGDMFADHGLNLQGNNDILSLTKPDVLESIHTRYLNAGADIITTNTFNSTTISQAEYGIDSIFAMNYYAALAARRAIRRYGEGGKFVAGSIGPTNRMASLPYDMTDLSSRNITFDQLVESYYTQVKGLIAGGVDLFLVETVFDTLNAKAALFAISRMSAKLRHTVPTIVSATISDVSGRLLSGQTIEAFAASMQNYPLYAIGLNCSLGAEQLEPYVERLARATRFPISIHPNAGLPDSCGHYHETPAQMAATVSKYLSSGRISIIGGCCGTTPDHVTAIAEVAHKFKFHIPEYQESFNLSGIEPLKSGDAGYIVVGEKTNVAGSKKFARLISQGNWDEAISIARAQVDAGAEVLDVCMDDSAINTPEAMQTFLRYLSADPDVSKVPIMVDSSDFTVLLSGLKCLQGRSIANSISLHDGEKSFKDKAGLIQRCGAAVVVMLADETGQAVTTIRRLEIVARSYKLLKEVGLADSDIIFDPNLITLGTGMEEHANSAISFLEACRRIHEEYPGVQISGGVSNLSFAFRGNNAIREALHTVFLYYATRVGLTMAIVNPETRIKESEISPELWHLCEELIFNRRPDATERLVTYASSFKPKDITKAANAWESLEPKERTEYAIEFGETKFLKEDINKLVISYGTPNLVVKGPLMTAMLRVGDKFNTGKMFLSQVVKSARAMKVAVAYLDPYFESVSTDITGTVVLATVNGDVHDIGKNLVSTVLSCNGFKIVDLGVMVPANAIVRAVEKERPVMVGLSGLISPSLRQMEEVVYAFNEAGITIPLFIGGAATTEQYVLQKLSPIYKGKVAYISDASQAAIAALTLIHDGN